MSILRRFQKRFFKIQQKIQDLSYESHWYLRFGWLDQDFENSQQLNHLFEIHSPEHFTFADCFYAEHQDRHFIFFEEISADHPVGFLSVVEIFKDGRYTVPKPILKLDYHLSYPCIFQVKNQWYMIPETTKNKTIELWKCTEFPDQWEKQCNLMENISAADSTPFFHNGIWYLFTSTKRQCKKFGDRLDLFYTQDILNPDWKEHPKNPVCSGVLQHRMAGKPFIYQNKLVRPSQDSIKRYGGKIQLNEILHLSPDDYQEQPLDKIKPDWNQNDDGCHTIHIEGRFVVMDAIRLRKKNMKINMNYETSDA